jgi:hypothetical protein
MPTVRRTPLSIAIVGAAALVLTACGGGSAGASSSTTSASSATTGAQGGGRFGGGAFPGASGLVAAVDGSTLQVQGSGTQTAVTWTASTRFTSQTAAKLSDVKVGLCVMVRTPATSGAPQPTTVQAASVAITPAVAGTCNAGGALGGRARPGGSTATRPPGATGRPTGGATRGFGGFGGVFGTVKSVSGSSFTVLATTPRRPTGSATTAPTTSPRTIQVTTASSTTYTKTVAATAKAAAVGTCVTALGKADDTGAISATTIAVRPAVNGACAGGAGRGFGGGPADTATGAVSG